MLTESQLPPLDPPDSHGEYAKYCEMVDDYEIRCIHDEDECPYYKWCYAYEALDYDTWKEVQEDAESND